MADRILTLNVGASKLLLAEFSVRGGRSPVLLNYGTAPLGDADASAGALGQAVREILRRRGIRPAPLMVALSGQMVFPRYVKLPAVGDDKLQQMVQYEVEQNVPFPLNEIVWNYQFIGDASTGEQSAMIVAAKVESVREVAAGIAAAGLDPEVIDVAPMALYNCLRYNSPELSGSAVVVDIGARSTNLVFVEDDKIYSRCIPVAGNAITQEIAKVFDIPFAEAEALKRERAFVSLGGVYAAADETDERISKIVRNVVTRLHAEISRSVNFYRSQQGGSAPARLILTGGSAVLPQLDTFFRDKLNVEVAVLNPFENVNFGAKVDKARLEQDAFTMAECVGLALRRSMKCPLEINLMPPEIAQRKTFNRRIPFLCLAALGALGSLGVWTLYEHKMAETYTALHEQAEAGLAKLQGKEKKFKAAQSAKAAVDEKAEGACRLIDARTLWLKRIQAVRRCADKFPGLWIKSVAAVGGDGKTPPTGIRIEGRIWKDGLDARTKDGRTVFEQFRDYLSKSDAFEEGEGVKIEGTRDVGGYVEEFTIQANFSGAKDAEEKGR